MLKNLNWNLLIISVIYFFCACGRGEDTELAIAELEAEQICEIDQSTEPLGYLNSLAVCSDRLFLCTGEGVREYGLNGEPGRKIGNIGRASGEYVRPMATRTDGHYIYVWSAMSLKFLIYDMDGSFIGECPYNSAIFDFIPAGNLLCIYTAGARSGRIVDIYDISKKVVVDSLVNSTPCHRTFSMVCNAPMTVLGDILYFMPRDEMKIYRYKLNSGENAELLGDFHSGTFKVPEVNDEMAVKHDQRKMRDFSDKASYILMLATEDGKKFSITTSEGEYRWEDGKRLKDKRFYSIYAARTNGGNPKVGSAPKGKIRREKRFPADNISDPALLSSFGGDFFFMKKTALDNSSEESWSLEKVAHPIM